MLAFAADRQRRKSISFQAVAGKQILAVAQDGTAVHLVARMSHCHRVKRGRRCSVLHHLVHVRLMLHQTDFLLHWIIRLSEVWMQMMVTQIIA